MNMNKDKKNLYIGILMIVLSSLCFAVMSFFIKSAGDLPTAQKSFFRNLVSFFFALTLMKRNGTPLMMPRGILKDLLLRSFFGTLGVLFYFYSVDHLVLSDATALNKLAPFFTILSSWLLLRERITQTQALAVAGAFAGSLLIIKPSFENVALFPAGVGFLSGLFAGLAYTMVRKLGHSGVNGSFVVLFFSGFSCISLLPLLLLDYHPMDSSQLGFLLMAGLFAGGGQFTITSAYFHAPARDISVYSYSQILFASLISFFTFGEWPDGWSFLGYGVILAMAVLMRRSGGQTPQPKQKQ
ncbi:MAG: DMT family transporter [Eubacteriales bacterium]|nr:DMT family transporter [Eubacteriales bacterium]MDD3289809.1 DMT family transporter [Eubacteriales bacterium]MDD3864158.1 DMT family transporter [Eubacteriales bacterium]